MKKILFTFIILTILIPGQGQSMSGNVFTPADSLNDTRRNGFLIVSGVAFTGTTIALDRLWYQDFPRSSFHFHNDNHHWKQMDKLGHIATAYWTGYHGMQALRWSGVNDRDAVIWGGMYGLPFLTAVEILDGFSREWGFSWGDQLANMLGPAILITQEKTIGEQRFQLKYSFTPSEHHEYRPDLLGNNLIEQSIKDYNGQTYWLSFQANTVTGDVLQLPDWLNIAGGYSADNLLGSVENPAYYNGNPMPELERHRQFFISLDVNWLKVEVSNPFLNGIINALAFIKVPFPAIEFNAPDGVRGHWFYF